MEQPACRSYRPICTRRESRLCAAASVRNPPSGCALPARIGHRRAHRENRVAQRPPPDSV